MGESVLAVRHSKRRWQSERDGVTMAQIAQLFAGYPSVGRPVIDRTGLTGKYDWHHKWTPKFRNRIATNPLESYSGSNASASFDVNATCP